MRYHQHQAIFDIQWHLPDRYQLRAFSYLCFDRVTASWAACSCQDRCLATFT